MKIALVVHDFDRRVGHGRYSFEVARHVALAHEVHVWANRFEPSPPPNVFYHPVPAWRATALASVLTFLVAAEPRLRRHAFDLVHAQGLTCWSADLITAHVCNEARRRADPPARWRQRLFPLLVCPLERRFYRQQRARALIAVSGVVAREIQECYGWCRPSYVVHHGTDLAHFQPLADAGRRATLRAHFGVPAGAWTWLFVGEAVKGLAAAMAALPAFPAAHLLVVSRSDPARFQRLAVVLGIGSRFVFHGPTDNAALAYQAADVLVYPSNYDAFGLVVAEAMACALPVVVGQRIGAAEWIDSGRNGLLCDPRDLSSLKAQLHRLATEPSLARRLGAAARETVEQHSWDVCAARTLAIYEELAQPGRRATAIPG
jgi:UDP-glucose:(heptosyl)LPS alpha-1,3-glucosyltransferase